jgi:hypothetical protein
LASEEDDAGALDELPEAVPLEPLSELEELALPVAAEGAESGLEVEEPAPALFLRA